MLVVPSGQWWQAGGCQNEGILKDHLQRSSRSLLWVWHSIQRLRCSCWGRCSRWKWYGPIVWNHSLVCRIPKVSSRQVRAAWCIGSGLHLFLAGHHNVEHSFIQSLLPKCIVGIWHFTHSDLGWSWGHLTRWHSSWIHKVFWWKAFPSL